MELEKICIRCGEVFIARNVRALRCPPCKRLANLERMAEQRRKLRLLKPPPDPSARTNPDRDKRAHFRTHFVDSPEKIAKCLNCKRATCYGICEEMTRRTT